MIRSKSGEGHVNWMAPSRGPGRRGEIDAHQQRLQVEAEHDFLDRPLRYLRHRTTFVLPRVSAGADPLEKRLPAVDLHVEEAARQRVRRPLTAAADRPQQ